MPSPCPPTAAPVARRPAPRRIAVATAAPPAAPASGSVAAAETPSDTAPRPRQRRKQARPQELLQSALELFVERGFAATPIDAVARRAGVSKGTVYLYYPSKEELFKAVVRHNLSSLIAEGEEMLRGFDGASGDLLGRLIRTWWSRIGDTAASGIHKVVLSEVRNFPELAQFYSDEVIVPADRLFGAVVQRGIDRGEFRPLPPTAVAQALMAPVIFAALHRHSFGACPLAGGVALDTGRLLDTHLDLVLRGLHLSTPGATR